MSILAVANWGVQGSATSVTVNLNTPSPTVGNLLLVYMVKDDNVLISSITAGYTEAFQSTAQSQITIGCWWRVVDGTETSVTITGDSEEYNVYVLELSGADTISPVISSSLFRQFNNASPTCWIPEIPPDAGFYGLIGSDRDRTIGPFVSPTVPWTEIYTSAGLGAGGASLYVYGANFLAGNPTAFLETNQLSAADEWGTDGVVVSPTLDTPVISSPTGVPETTTPSSAQITGVGFTTDVTQGTGYYYLSSSATPPTYADLESGAGSIQDGSVVVTSTTVSFSNITSLSPNTSYFLHFAHTNFVKQSNIITINVSTPPFTIPLEFRDVTQEYYIGRVTRWKTTYQNTGTAYATLTSSPTPPNEDDVVAGSPVAWIDRDTDPGWTVSADPNLLFGSTGVGGVDIFENTTNYIHAFIDDPGSGGRSATVTHTFTTRQLLTLANITLVVQSIDTLQFEYDLVINESTSPRARFVLNQSPTPLNGDQIRSGGFDYDSGDVTLATTDGTYLTPEMTGLLALTTYYLHITIFDLGNQFYQDDLYYPVYSPATPFANTALNTSVAAVNVSRARIFTDPALYDFVRFGDPARNVAGITEVLTWADNNSTVNQERVFVSTTEALLLSENLATIQKGVGDLTINANTEVLLWSDNDSTVGQGKTAAGGTEVLVLATSAAVIDRGRNALTVTEELLWADNNSVVAKTFNRAVTTNTEVLVITEFSATVDLSTIERLILTANSATIRKDVSILALSEALLWSSNNAIVQQQRLVAGVTEAIILSDADSTITRDRLTATQTEALLIQGNTATVRKDPNVFGVTEELTVAPTTAVVQKDAFVDGDTQPFVITANTADIRRGRTPRGDTQKIVFESTQADIVRDRLTQTATEGLVLTLTSSVVGRGKTVRSVTELLVTQGTPAPLRRDRLVSTLPEAETKTLIVAKAVIGRGITVRTGFERLILQTTQASFKRGANIQAQTEELTFAVLPVSVGRGKLIVGATENMVLQTETGLVAKSTDKSVVCDTEALTLLPHGATIVQDTVLQLASEQLILGTTRSIVQQIRRAEGQGLPFYGKEGVMIVPPTLKAQAKNSPRSGVLVLNPPEKL